MKSVSEMNDAEKSVALAKLVWREHWLRPGESLFYDDSLGEYPVWTSHLSNSLYDTSEMRLAWQVLNWAMGQRFELDKSYTFCGKLHDYLTDIERGEFEGIFEFPPADAQRIWLDKILQLAEEAGLVK